MQKKVILKRVKVLRDGVAVYPEIGKVFAFTDAEIEQMEESEEEFFRDAVNETSSDEEEAEADAEVKKPKPKPVPKGGKGKGAEGL